jgi:transposase
MTLTREQKLYIYTLRQQGKTINDICMITGHGNQAVQKYANHPDISNKENITPGRGRKRKLSEDEMKQVNDIAKSHKQLGSRRITPIINQQLNINLTDRSIRNYLSPIYEWKPKPKRKWVLSEDAKKNRVKWAKQRMGQTDWNKWVFSDEASFDYSGIHGQRKPRDEPLVIEKNRWSARCSVWWAISTKWKFKPVIYTERQDGAKYIEILKQGLPHQHIRHLPQDWVFQQDNSGVHSSKLVTTWLEAHVPNYCKDWPAYSPDLNPIENVWSMVKEQVSLHDPKSLQQLKDIIKDIINNIPQTTIANTILNMDTRLQSCINLNGAHTKY